MGTLLRDSNMQMTSVHEGGWIGQKRTIVNAQTSWARLMPSGALTLANNINRNELTLDPGDIKKLGLKGWLFSILDVGYPSRIRVSDHDGTNLVLGEIPERLPPTTLNWVLYPYLALPLWVNSEGAVEIGYATIDAPTPANADILSIQTLAANESLELPFERLDRVMFKTTGGNQAFSWGLHRHVT